MEKIYGVVDAVSGYANGKTKNPKYEDLIYRGSGHAEAVFVKYDANKISLETLLKYYFRIIDPTSCLLYTSPSPRDVEESRMPSSA